MQQHSLLCYGGLMNKRLKLYNVNIKYIQNLHKVDNNVPSVSPQLIHWKKLCIKELNWCQSHQNEIEHLANELYDLYSSNMPFTKRKICLNFPALEKECNKAKKL